PECNGLRGLIGDNVLGQPTAHLGHFESVCKPGMEYVRFTSADYLSNSSQAPKGGAVKNPVAVALKRISLVLWACGISPPCAFRAKDDQFSAGFFTEGARIPAHDKIEIGPDNYLSRFQERSKLSSNFSRLKSLANNSVEDSRGGLTRGCPTQCLNHGLLEQLL